MTSTNWNYIYSFLTCVAAGLAIRVLHQAVLKRGVMAVTSNETLTEIREGPGLVSPALKRLINKIKP